jgi:hypothetical protein
MERETMTTHERTTRRRLLRTGIVAAGATTFGVPAVAGGQSTTQRQQDGLAAKVENDGHYSWFPLERETWGRSDAPYDMEKGESRWLAEPEPDGGVRCLGRHLGTDTSSGNTGFDLHLGALGDVETITVTSRTLRTSRDSPVARLFVGLYLDKDDNDDFFEWEAGDGADSFVGFGDDDEGIVVREANEEFTIDGDTSFNLNRAGTEATLAELQAGRVEGITGDTNAALYVGVINEGEGTDEVVVEEVQVQRRTTTRSTTTK